MDLTFCLELIVLVTAIAVGAKWGGAGLGVAGGLGMFVLVFGFDMKPGTPPISVLLIITAVVTCASILQGAGGLDYLVTVAEKLLRKNPRYITFMGPLICYLSTLFCGTAYVAYAMYPVIAEVAMGARVRPERPLTMSVLAAQSGITGSPMSAATAAMIGFLASLGVTPIQIFAVSIPACFIGLIVGCCFMFKRGKELCDDPKFQQKIANGEFTLPTTDSVKTSFGWQAKTAVWIFAAGIALIVFLGSCPTLLPSFTESSDKVTRLSIPHMVQIIMLATACLIMVCTKIAPNKVAGGSVFRSGLIGMVAVYGVSWLTGTFFGTYMPLFTQEFGSLITNAPIIFAIVMFVLSALLFSQGATIAALIPVGIGLGIAPNDFLWMYPACNGMFLIPASGAIIACVSFDRTGSTKIGNYVLNHSYVFPGLITTVCQLIAGYCITIMFF